MTCEHTHYVDVASGVRECVDCGARIGVVVQATFRDFVEDVYRKVGPNATPPPYPTLADEMARRRYVHLQSGDIVEDPTE